MKQKVRLTESDLHSIINESVKRVLNEISDDTLNSAMYASCNKVANCKRKYGDESKVTGAAKDQRQKFFDEYLKKIR